MDYYIFSAYLFVKLLLLLLSLLLLLLLLFIYLFILEQLRYQTTELNSICVEGC